MKKSFILGLALAVCAGCAFGPGIDYRIALTEVERPEDAKDRYGEAKVTTEEEEGQSQWHFSDELVRIAWIPTSTAIEFILENKSNHSLKILWDQASLVGPDGVSHRVMHEGVPYMDRNSPQAPTVVPKGAKITESVYAPDMIEFNTAFGWLEDPVLHLRPKGTAGALAGKTIRILLPMEIEGVVNEYTFTLTVESATAKRSAGKK